jgi:predicted acylesterase/phospholipase RssA
MFNQLAGLVTNRYLQPDGLCLMGGGILGAGHIGGLQALEDLGKLDSIKYFSGASIGSLIVALAAMKYSPFKLKEQLAWNFSDILGSNWPGPLNAIEDYGLYDGLEFKRKIDDLIEKASGNKNTTFKELYDMLGSTLTIVATRVYKHGFEPVYFSHTSHPNMIIAEAVYNSCTYPGMFKVDNLLIDGGLSDNYPIDKLSGLQPLGFAFEYSIPVEKEDPNNVIEFMLGVTNGIINQIGNTNKIKNTIFIPTLGVTAMELGIDKGRLGMLYNSGYQTVTAYFR